MSRLAALKYLRERAPVIAPSMLKCDFGNLHREVELLEAAGADVLHLDVMDGHFVPNLTYGPVVIERLRELTELPFDAHLMISDPGKYLDEYIQAGCQAVTFHVEAAGAQAADLLGRIREADCLAGIALNPDTPVERIEPLLPDCDLVLVMSVQPGFGGQAFQPASLNKLERLRASAPAETLLSLDGGVDVETIASAAIAGADVFVSGSAIFDRPDYRTAIDQLRSRAHRTESVTSSST
jgi:ribulose-phosphate 3-epimerase